MHRLKQVKIFVLLIFSSFQLTAGSVADLAFEFEFNEVNGVVLEEQGDFIARVTNLGPSIAGENSSFTYPIALLSGLVQFNGVSGAELEFFPGPQNNNQECFFVVAIGSPPPGGNGPVYAYDINVQSIGVNETVECYGQFSRSFQSGRREVTWEIRNFDDTDPNSTNNSQVIIFGIPPQTVGTLSRISLLVLILIAWGLGIKYSKELVPIH